jgi:ABC-2 type transport system ATP-binding protein
MTNAFELRNVTKVFGDKTALDSVSLAVPPRSIIGLVGRNGSGKTTLLRHITGLYLPTSGTCYTLGCPTPKLGPAELSRIGAVNQHDKFIEWMKGGQFIRYISTFYPVWDRDLEHQLVEDLDVDLSGRLGVQSPGNLQKIGLIIATCHKPSLLLLDEPVSDLDPIVRARTIRMLLDRFNDEELTMVISSHMLHDLERIVDRVIFVDRARIVADESLDDLRERYAEWNVVSPTGNLPSDYAEDFVLSAEGDALQAQLIVKHSESALRDFKTRYNASIDVVPLNLERIFPLIVGKTPRRHDIRLPLPTFG